MPQKQEEIVTFVLQHCTPAERQKLDAAERTNNTEWYNDQITALYAQYYFRTKIDGVLGNRQSQGATRKPGSHHGDRHR